MEPSARIFAHRDTVTEGQRPWHREPHVSVLVGFGHAAALLLGLVLAFLEYVVDVRLYVGVRSLTVVVVLLVVVVIVVAVAEELFQLFGVKGKRDVLRESLEHRQPVEVELGVVAEVVVPVVVVLIGVHAESCVHGERVALPPSEAQPHRGVAPSVSGCRGVVRHVQSQLVDNADFFHARRVLVALDFGLDIVGNVKADALCLSVAGHCVELVLVW